MSKETESVFAFLRSHSGTSFSAPQTKGGWFVLGPFGVEFHGWWIRLGCSLGAWYVALYLGPLVLSFGRRKWGEKRSPWTTSLSTYGPKTLTVTWTPQGTKEC